MTAVLATGLLGEIEQSLGDLDSVLAMWKVRRAREAAWTNGEVLWHLRDTPLLGRESGPARFADRVRRPRTPAAGSRDRRMSG